MLKDLQLKGRDWDSRLLLTPQLGMPQLCIARKESELVGPEEGGMMLRALHHSFSGAVLE